MVGAKGRRFGVLDGFPVWMCNASHAIGIRRGLNGFDTVLKEGGICSFSPGICRQRDLGREFEQRRLQDCCLGRMW